MGMRFYFDETGNLFGPGQYFDEQGDALLKKIMAGEDAVFNTCAHLSPDVQTAILVRLQTDFAGWLGQKEMEGWLKA